MGCGCNKRGAGASPASARVTVYEVIKDGATVSEFGTLPEARLEATRVSGRVKVTSRATS